MARSNNFLKRLMLAILLIVIIGLAAYAYRHRSTSQAPLPPAEVTYNEPHQPLPSDNKPGVPLPKSLQIKVPFTPQAPTANWDELHNESCEEASTIMAHAYFAQIDNLPPAFVEQELSKITDWEDRTYGYHLDIDTQETARLIEEFYSLKTQIVDMSKLAIKQALFENKLVIVAANGQLLNNPNFKQPGPIYHMLVITGYDGDTFTTNDPGTRKGENYQYSYDTLHDAAGTWESGQHAVNLQNKQLIIISN